MINDGLSQVRLQRLHAVMAGYVERGELPGMVTAVSRRGHAHVDAIGTTAFGGNTPMRRDTLFRIASLTKPVTAAAAMILIEQCRMQLDEPVDRWLPELANRRVLSHLGASLSETVPAERRISVRDLLTLRLGLGAVMAPPDEAPIAKAMQEAGVAPRARLSELPPDEWMRRLGSLPLLHQPGSRFMYDTGLDVLGVLIARVAGKPLETFMREQLFEPLGMHDTGFSVSATELARLAPCYEFNAQTKAFDTFDEAGDQSRFTRPPVFPAGAGGLVSTADDCLAFFSMLLNQGRHGRERILSRPSVELMTTNHLLPEHKVGAEIFLGDYQGWGFGMSVITRRGDYGNVGRFGWVGGYGTAGYADPKEALIDLLLTQRVFASPDDGRVLSDFWTSVYQAIDD